MADLPSIRPVTLPVMSRGLAAVKAIDAVLQKQLVQRAVTVGGDRGVQTASQSAAKPVQKPVDETGAAFAAGGDPMAGLAFETISLVDETAVTTDREAEDGATGRASSEAVVTTRGVNSALSSQLVA